jgi:hypothetical protein
MAKGSTVRGFSHSLGERELPRVEMIMAAEDNIKLLVDGWPALSSGSLRQACDVIRRLGFKPGDEYTMVIPNRSQVTVRLRTPEQRANGVSPIVRKGDSK